MNCPKCWHGLKRAPRTGIDSRLESRNLLVLGVNLMEVLPTTTHLPGKGGNFLRAQRNTVDPQIENRQTDRK